MMKTHGEVIREIRTNKGVSQKAVYSDIISKSYAIEFEKGTHEISLRLFEQILERLMISIDEFTISIEVIAYRSMMNFLRIMQRQEIVMISTH